MAHPIPPPIEPDGVLDGLVWPAIVAGALLDIVLTMVAGIPATLWLAGADAEQDPAAAEAAFEQALATPEGMLLSAGIGLTATAVGAWYGARRAGVFHVRHGGWVAMVSAALGLLFLTLPAAPAAASAPPWFDALTMAAMLPAGLLGGFVASRFGANRA